jgi:hypothetical protein
MKIKFDTKPDPQLASAVHLVGIGRDIRQLIERVRPKLNDHDLYHVEVFHRDYKNELQFEITTGTGRVLVDKQSLHYEGSAYAFDSKFWKDLFMLGTNDRTVENKQWLKDLYSIIIERLVQAYVTSIDDELGKIRFDQDRTCQVLRLYLSRKTLNTEQLALQVSEIGLSVVEKLAELAKARQISAESPPAVKVSLVAGEAVSDEPAFDRWSF